MTIFNGNFRHLARWMSIICIVLLLAGCGDPEPVSLELGGRVVVAELAVTPKARNRGLMNRDHLGADEGMLFVFPSQRIRQFWMRNTPIPLDIGFFDREGVLVNYLSMSPNSDTIHRSSKPALYALEMNRGWYRQNGIEPGMKLHLPYEIEGR
ncbi:MAG: DUF192 domain-containing protein [Sedimenticola sp.]